MSANTDLVSMTSTGALSADGRFVTFVAFENTDPPDPNAHDNVFVRDTHTGTTTLVSRASGASGLPANAESVGGSISADGRYVAFSSDATNLSDGDRDDTTDAFVRDLQTNVTTLVGRASGPDGVSADRVTVAGALSGNGRYLSLVSRATNFGADGVFGSFDVFVRDLETHRTTLVHRQSGVCGTPGDGEARGGSLSHDGRLVAFTSWSSNLSIDDRPVGDVFVRDASLDLRGRSRARRRSAEAQRRPAVGHRSVAAPRQARQQVAPSVGRRRLVQRRPGPRRRISPWRPRPCASDAMDPSRSRSAGLRD